ncbi:hypothetical protein [Aureimonas sp. ME7]|uniref:hypothetical protein n=1 Tax=Aureimonas sp. ME7 TaxID=2744252 RepID=UPI0015F3FA19|nr:hypothetical protein [Aureimonas sp. ME7]
MRKARVFALGLGALLTGAAFIAAREAPDPARIAAPRPIESARKLFVSGHSLTTPLIGPLNRMTPPLDVVSHSIDGSTIRQRRDTGPSADTDILLVTEQHRLLDAMTLADTVGSLREMHERFRALNPSGVTVFYTSWADLSDPEAPEAWVEFERRAAPVWACLAHRAGEGSDAIRVLPASLALADLVAALTAEPDAFPGFEGTAPRAITQAMFTDRVHVSPLGGFFLARLSAEFLVGSERAASLRAPPDLDPAQVRSVSQFAAGFAKDWRAAGAPADPCRGATPAGFVPAYTDYMEATYGQSGESVWRKEASRLRHALALYRRLLL